MAKASDKTKSIFTEKLARLCETRTKAAVDRLAGLREGTVAVWIKHGVLPPPFATLKLARALQVDWEWLVDEENPGLNPPPSREDQMDVELRRRDRLAMLPQSDLMQELARRFYGAAQETLRQLASAQSIAWEEVAIGAWSASQRPGEATARQGLADWPDAQVRSLLDNFDLDQWAQLHHDRQSARGEAPSISQVREQWEALVRERPGLTALRRLGELRRLSAQAPDDPAGLHRRGLLVSADQQRQREAPVILAHLLSHPQLRWAPEYEDLRQSLRTSGFLDDAGEPTEPLPWSAERDERPSVEASMQV